MRSSMSCGCNAGTLASAAWMIVAASSSGRSPVSEPLKARPIGERAVETITASGIGLSCFGSVRRTLTLGDLHPCGQVLLGGRLRRRTPADDRQPAPQPREPTGTGGGRALAAFDRLDLEPRCAGGDCGRDVEVLHRVA